MTDQQINIAVARADLFLTRYGKHILVAVIMLIIFMIAMAVDSRR